MRNSLSALNLTLMDAFGPASVPHSSKHVPLLGKKVSSKLFESLFPLAHVTNGKEVTLINPNGVSLTDYERKLDKQIEIYYNRLSRLVCAVLPENKRCGLTEESGTGDENEEDDAPSYKECREALREAMSDCGWPRPQEDFDLLEEEVALANNFKKYLQALKKEAEKANHRGNSSDEGTIM